VVLEIHLKVPMNFSLGLTATVDAPNNNMDVIQCYTVKLLLQHVVYTTQFLTRTDTFDIKNSTKN
jgi:hypothetical protein